MTEGRVMNRWYVVIGAILIQLCLGAIYAWSVFTPALMKPVVETGKVYVEAKKSTFDAGKVFLKDGTTVEAGKIVQGKNVLVEGEKVIIEGKAVPGGKYGFTAGQTQWVFSAGLLIFAIVMVAAGRMMKKVGPKKLATSGGIVLGIGYILGGLLGSSFVAQLICIGVIGGAGIGLAYVVPIAVGVKWFPDKKGMVTGLAVAGFGFGALIWVKSAGAWFNLINTLNFFGLGGVQSVFFLYGVIFLVAVLLGSIVMVDPPAGYVPEGWTPPAPASTGTPAAFSSGMNDFEPAQMMKTPQFYMTWLTFLFSAMAGLMVIGVIALFGIDALKSSGLTVEAAAAVAGTAMGWYAILNGLGRIVWGTVSDKIGRKISIFLMCLLQGIIMLLFYKMGFAAGTLILGACIIGFNFGGNFALFPAITADYFGNKNVGLNYGYVFLSYGIAGIIGPQIAGYFKDTAKGSGDPSVWITPFMIAGIACLVGAAITLIVKPPKKA